VGEFARKEDGASSPLTLAKPIERAAGVNDRQGRAKFGAGMDVVERPDAFVRLVRHHCDTGG
jgi:hypothetical protein